MSVVEELNKREADYLLSIFLNSRDKGYARNMEIMRTLNVSKSTVSLMVRKLERKRLVVSERAGVRLTDRGRETVASILWRHGVMESALTRLGVPVKEACRITWEIGLRIPEKMLDVIWRNLGRPERCPCGLRFPSPLDWGEVERYSLCGLKFLGRP